jgi:hypothetical protein
VEGFLIILGYREIQDTAYMRIGCDWDIRFTALRYRSNLRCRSVCGFSFRPQKKMCPEMSR